MRRSTQAKRAVSALGLTATVSALVAVAVFGSSSVSATEGCTTQRFAWTDIDLDIGFKIAYWEQTVDTGMTIPAPAADETLRVTAASYSAFDRYADGTVPSRSDVDQQHEQFGITIGGTQVGSLSPDLPDTLVEGASTINYSGLISGSLPGAAGTVITGGKVIIRHSSLYGFVESPNSLHPSSVTLDVERCKIVPPTTVPPTTIPPTTVPVTTIPVTTVPVTTVPVTTVPVTTVPVTTGASTTTSVASGGPTTTSPATTSASTTTIVASGGPTTTAKPVTMPVTGRSSNGLLPIGAIAVALGAVLLLVRRRALQA